MNWFKRRLYEWHLNRAERINAVLNTNAYHSSGEIRALTRVRQDHIAAMIEIIEGK